MNPDEQQDGSVGSPLCQRCKSFDLQDFFSGVPADTDRILHVFEPPHHLRPECPLCCAVAFIRPDLSDNYVYHLVKAQKNFEDPSNWLNFAPAQTYLEDTGNRLTVWQCGDSKAQIWTPHTKRNEQSLPGGLGLTSDLHPCEKSILNLPGKIDFDVVKGWMNKCKNGRWPHHSSCKTEPRTSNVPNLRLIDCATREIRPYQEGDLYTALSYCWGASQASQADGMGTPNFQLPQHLPATIEDAILATQKLGIKYIWIDRYCVPQGSEDPGRHEQISLMHKIYMGAEVTLIAAAGDSPTYGLPGVSKERRKPPKVRFGSHTMVATFPDPCILIASSKWSTRGWTYQEALLSRRKLVFTDHQVYFQYNEILQGPFDYVKVYRARSEAVSWSSAGIDSCNISEDIAGFFEFEFNPTEIWSRINEYTQRSLSRQEDIMNAMLGIFEHYTETKWDSWTFWHIFGIPICCENDPVVTSWRSTFLVNLTWGLQTPSKRREGFPSWSWAGWEGTGFVGGTPLSFGNEQHFAAVYAKQDDEMLATDMDLVIQKEPDTTVHWKIPHIIFKCPSVPLHIKKLSQCSSPSHDERYSQLKNELDLRVVMQSGEILHSYNFQLLPRDLVDDPGLDKGIPCVGLVIDPPGHSVNPSFRHSWKSWTAVLLVVESQQRKAGKLYERIGQTTIPDEHLEGILDKRGYFIVG